YDYDNRYFVDASIRRDGSSRFAPGHRWGTFYAFGGRWNINNEAFLKDVTWIDELSIRVNYGEIGNSGIPNYRYFGKIDTAPSYGPDNTVGNEVLTPGNKYLTWEKTKSFDFGVNFRFLDRFTVDVDAYKKKTTDMLMAIPWSYTTGFSGDWGNAGAMTNTGVELLVNADVYKSKDWYVGVNANISYNKNEITELFDGLDAYTKPNTGTRYEVGKSATDYYYVKYAGVDPRDGKQLWYTPAGNLTKVYNEESMAQFLGQEYIAPWNGGFGAQARWKGLSIRADFNFSLKKYLMNNDKRYVQGVDLFIQGCNQTTDMLNIWTKPGQITDIPAATETVEFDSRFIENASFMRLKNLTVSYTLPKTLLDKMYLSDLTFHFTGRNLWTVTNYTGMDPEPAVNRVLFFYPNTRQFEFGVEVSF
ncbi:MAG: TonB-dependent receptor, partial [Clostridiales bacterium]|nr:TonB-dependent receptor [Clostridiales bacterium]